MNVRCLFLLSLFSMISGMQEKVLSEDVLQKVNRAKNKVNEAKRKLDATTEWQEIIAKYNTWEDCAFRRKELYDKGQYDNAIDIEHDTLWNDFQQTSDRLSNIPEDRKYIKAREKYLKILDENNLIDMSS